MEKKIEKNEVETQEPNWKEEYEKLARSYHELQIKLSSALNLLLKLGEKL